MLSDGTVTDFEGTVLAVGDIIVFMAGGFMGRGRITELRMPAVFGAMLVQSLINPKRLCVVSPAQSVLIERAPLPACASQASTSA